MRRPYRREQQQYWRAVLRRHGVSTSAGSVHPIPLGSIWLAVISHYRRIHIRPRPLPIRRPGHPDSDDSRRRLCATLRSRREVTDHRQTGMFPIRRRHMLHCNAYRCRAQAPPHGRYSVQSSHATADDAATSLHGRRHPRFSCPDPHVLSQVSCACGPTLGDNLRSGLCIPGIGIFGGRRLRRRQPPTGASTGTGQGVSVN